MLNSVDLHAVMKILVKLLIQDYLHIPRKKTINEKYWLGVLELLIVNEKDTDRPTCAKQYALSSSKGGIIKTTVTST